VTATPQVRAVFAALIVATVGGFLASQYLKGEEPLVLRFSRHPNAISPNGDGLQDSVRLGFVLSQSAEVSFSVIDSNGQEVRRLVRDRRLPGDTRLHYTWDGRDDSGHLVRDGVYRMRVVRRAEGRSVNSGRRVRVDTRPPRLALAGSRPSELAVGHVRPVRVRYRGTRDPYARFKVFRTDHGAPREVARFNGDGPHTGTWNGTVAGRPAPAGSYAFAVAALDPAGNLGRSPTPPTAASASPRSGVAVRGLELRGPLGVLAAGSVARLRVGPRPARVRFTLRRLGSGRALARGARGAGLLRLRMPRRSRTGLYVADVRTPHARADWPLAVAGLPTGRGAGPRPLVVLPGLSWQGGNPVDDDLDGFPDTLDVSRRAALDRTFAGGRLPRPLRDQAGPLLAFLDRSRLPYDLTTDLALLHREGPVLGNAPGVALAGDVRWLPAELGGRLRRYVIEGGRVAIIGADSLRRGVRVQATQLVDPIPAKATDVFGERTAELRTGPAPLELQRRGAGLFRGAGQLFGSFTRLERSLELPPDGRLVASAGRARDRVFVAYRLGRGLVVRVGSQQWASQLAEVSGSQEVQGVTGNLWRTLAR
jgi:flagellar hook capping protein FlgD